LNASHILSAYTQSSEKISYGGADMFFDFSPAIFLLSHGKNTKYMFLQATLRKTSRISFVYEEFGLFE
jgi:hypothetical protein